MSKVVLLRHARTEAGNHGGDLARKLTAAGRKQAHSLGGQLREILAEAETWLVSPAVRAQQTLAELRSGAGLPSGIEVPEAVEVPEIYSGDPVAMWEAIRALSIGKVSVVVGHEPTISELARQVSSGEQTHQISGGVPTATAMVVECAVAASVQEWQVEAAELVQVTHVEAPV